MNIRRAVDEKLFVVRQLFAPCLFIVADTPIVAIKASPENSSSVSVDILLRKRAAVIAFDVAYTDRIIGLAADRDRASPDHVQ